MPDGIDREGIITAMAAGENAARVAARLGVSIKQVRTAMSEAVSEMATADTLREEWFLEDHRLKTLGLRFYEIALRDNDPQAAVVFLKASERRANLGGANAPTSFVIHTTSQVPVHQMTNAEKMAEALDNFLGIGEREKELRHRNDLTEEETAELFAFEDV